MKIKTNITPAILTSIASDLAFAEKAIEQSPLNVETTVFLQSVLRKSLKKSVKIQNTAVNISDAAIEASSQLMAGGK